MSDARILSREDCQAILERAHALAEGGGETEVLISSWWQGELRWARNRVSMASDRRNLSIQVRRTLPAGAQGAAQTNQLDDASLRGVVHAAERASGLRAKHGRGVGYYPELPPYDLPSGAPIWSDATYALDSEARGATARGMISPAEAEGFQAAGYLEVRAGSHALLGTGFPELRSQEHAFWEQPYQRWTQAQCSTTVRDRSGAASGWAARASYDWERIEGASVGELALQKAAASRDPVAIEPGRYTVILEPQAVADLMEPLAASLSQRELPDRGQPSPWRLTYDDALRLWRTRLGLRVTDERITISHDPADPRLGLVMNLTERPEPVTWIDGGVLTAIGHRVETDIRNLEGHHRLRGPTGYRMNGGDSNLDEMIRTTRRGLLVTRLSNVRTLDTESLLATGLTRDGLWLIENGQITRAVKNFRFTESPLFVLNSIEQMGEAVPVFRPTRNELGRLTPAIVPAIRARDFSFTSLIDAV